MAGILLSGPAGAGKSQQARDELDSRAVAVVVDFQTIYAGLLQLRRREDGRYPEREDRHAHVLPLAEYTRRAMITGARQREIDVIATNSDGSPERRAQLLELLGTGASERVIDPGRAVVVSRLSEDGVLSEQCEQAIGRWYGRL